MTPTKAAPRLNSPVPPATIPDAALEEPVLVAVLDDDVIEPTLVVVELAGDVTDAGPLLNAGENDETDREVTEKNMEVLVLARAQNLLVRSSAVASEPAQPDWTQETSAL